MMRGPMGSTRATLLALAIALVSGPSRAQLHEPDDPESLYQQGVRQMKRASYDEAVLSFEKVRNHFPFNQWSVLAELRVADCQFEKGSYLEAADAYAEFVRLHPRHEEVDYAVFRSARSELQLAPVESQKDQSHTRRGLDGLRRFEANFPQSRFTEEARRRREKAEQKLATAAVAIGDFYWRQKAWKAAERRYRMAVDEFPLAAVTARAQYRRALCLGSLGRWDEARATMANLGVARSGTGWGRRAERWLLKNPPQNPPQVTPEPAPESAPPLDVGM
jgi:outer membrane protein assembly factor BamD